MDITDIRIRLCDEDKLKGFVSVTFDKCFVIRGMKIIEGSSGYFIAMPSRKRQDGTFQDVAHPINAATRKWLEDEIIAAFELEMQRFRGRESYQPSRVADRGEMRPAYMVSPKDRS